MGVMKSTREKQKYIFYFYSTYRSNSHKIHGGLFVAGGESAYDDVVYAIPAIDKKKTLNRQFPYVLSVKRGVT